MHDLACFASFYVHCMFGVDGWRDKWMLDGVMDGWLNWCLDSDDDDIFILPA